MIVSSFIANSKFRTDEGAEIKDIMHIHCTYVHTVYVH